MFVSVLYSCNKIIPVCIHLSSSLEDEIEYWMELCDKKSYKMMICGKDDYFDGGEILQCL